ncbi:MAG: type II toxin-antitoxin system VapC family toxin [Bacteroidota bacterium]
MIVLDTHVWLWWLLGEGSLSDEERLMLNQHAERGEIAISMASVWEVESLTHAGKIDLQPDLTSWLKQATQPEVCSVLPITQEIILKQQELPPSFPNDPADRLIVATALFHNSPIATKDHRLLELGF